MTLTSYFMEATYLVASILFILSLKMMSHPETARRGMFLAEGGMFAAIVGTLVGAHIVTWVVIADRYRLGHRRVDGSDRSDDRSTAAGPRLSRVWRARSRAYSEHRRILGERLR